jgi:hypothetical protein
VSIASFFGRLLRSFRDMKRLTTFYRGLSTAVAWIGISLGLVALVWYIPYSMQAFGLPLEGGSLEGIRIQFLCWVTQLMLASALLIYGGAMLTAGILVVFLLALGKVDRRQALAYVLYAEYPRSWFRPEFRVEES